ncbi:type II toxin-antitoxin system VapB family antitoxin [Nocardiopsis sp. EMB25]|uniref:type II toxin-antitoxin system VapB family antitoxin n=1 Tax=Nocardiopsis sp. EMB25 TaxID=2835867 RepID=UPI002284D12F|nr:type II toxin-antitoxin system VapB family antitoxin [Nocardiopsis sp. EMB25]MCY9787372.1 type II toxin-antitoxin system VapB family antitoxin [Nocardiopsis sp. EMB25]
MGRSVVDVDDELVTKVTRKFNARTKSEAAEIALRHMIASVSAYERLKGLEGSDIVESEQD